MNLKEIFGAKIKVRVCMREIFLCENVIVVLSCVLFHVQNAKANERMQLKLWINEISSSNRCGSFYKFKADENDMTLQASVTYTFVSVDESETYLMANYHRRHENEKRKIFSFIYYLSSASFVSSLLYRLHSISSLPLFKLHTIFFRKIEFL